MPTVSTSDFRNGMVMVLDGELFSIVEYQHVKPGKGVAFVRTRLKSLKTGNVLDRTFRSGDKVEEARVERHQMQYLYNEGDHYYMMDLNSYEQIPVSTDLLGQGVQFLKENMVVDVLMHGSTPIGVELPFFVELRVVSTDPGVRGDTVTGGTKPATLETGAVVQVPLFVNVGDVLRLDTRTKTYIERV